MGGGFPGRSGLGAVGVAEGYMDAGKFFVLENVADDPLDADVGADGDLADAVGVFVGVGVGPEVALEVLVFAGDAGDAVAFDIDGEGVSAEDAVTGAEEVADDAIDDEDAVDLAGRGKTLAAGEVAPLLGADDAGGLEPAILRVELGVDVGSGGRGGADVGGVADFSRTAWERRSMARKSARMPWVMISAVMLTMWAWRMRRRLTTSVICIRLWSSLGWTSTAKMLTWEVSMSARTVAGISVSGRGARASRTKAFQTQPMRSSSLAREAAMVRQRSSVMRVTFSDGWIRRQVVTALWAPGMKSAGKSTVRRSVTVCAA